MKLECPTCRKISRLTGDLLVTPSEGLEVKCPGCKSRIKLYVLAKSSKDGSWQTSYDPFRDQTDPSIAGNDKQAGSCVLKSKILRNLVNLPPMPHIILRAQEIMSRATRFWRFSDSQSIAIRFHHYPSMSESHQLAHIVHLANFVAKTTDMGAGNDESEPEIEAGVLKFLQIPQAALEDIGLRVIESIKQLEQEFQGEAPSSA